MEKGTSGNRWENRSHDSSHIQFDDMTKKINRNSLWTPPPRASAPAQRNNPVLSSWSGKSPGKYFSCRNQTMRAEQCIILPEAFPSPPRPPTCHHIYTGAKFWKHFFLLKHCLQFEGSQKTSSAMKSLQKAERNKKKCFSWSLGNQSAAFVELCWEVTR